jgi:NADPH:quinone reductase-like Zn-dependent oxidoreductase
VAAVAAVDVVLDAVGGDYGPRSLPTLRPGGTLVAIVFSHVDYMRSAAKDHHVRLEYLTVEADHAGITAIAALVDKGLLRPELDGVVPLEQVAEAHRRGETRRTAGKIVLTVAE